MADSKRRGEDAVDEPLDEALVDAGDDRDDDDDDVLGDDVADKINNRGRTAARRRSSNLTGAGKTAKTVKTTESVGLFERVARFFREVVAELRKVNWPSRKELLTYTAVVIVFVILMMSIVGGLDYAFAWAVGHVFGG